MYGVLNKAVEDFVLLHHDQQTWQAIKTKAGIEDAFFVSMEPYPDKITYDLAFAASDILGAPVGDVLVAVGKHWVSYAKSQGYEDMFTMWGDNLVEFLHNLDMMHARVKLAMPDFQPPQFQCENSTKNYTRLHYHTHRQGLAPMLVGILHGLAEHFGVTVTLEHALVRDDEAGITHDEFDVHISEAAE